jgi:hypothetical protein
MRNQRNALLWALVSWLVRRWVRRRTAATVAGVTGRVSAGPGRVRGVVGAFALVGVLAVALIAWRKLAGGESTEWETSVDAAPEPIATGEPIPA